MNSFDYIGLDEMSKAEEFSKVLFNWSVAPVLSGSYGLSSLVRLSLSINSDVNLTEHFGVIVYIEPLDLQSLLAPAVTVIWTEYIYIFFFS